MKGLYEYLQKSAANRFGRYLQEVASSTLAPQQKFNKLHEIAKRALPTNVENFGKQKQLTLATNLMQHNGVYTGVPFKATTSKPVVSATLLAPKRPYSASVLAKTQEHTIQPFKNMIEQGSRAEGAFGGTLKQVDNKGRQMTSIAKDQEFTSLRSDLRARGDKHPKAPTFADTHKLDPEGYTNFSHGGSEAYVNKILGGGATGYRLEGDRGLGLQVHPHLTEKGRTHEMANRESYYANRGANGRYLDNNPVVLQGRIKNKYLVHAPNNFEAGIHTKHFDKIENGKVTKLPSAKFDMSINPDAMAEATKLPMTSPHFQTSHDDLRERARARGKFY